MWMVPNTQQWTPVALHGNQPAFMIPPPQPRACGHIEFSLLRGPGEGKGYVATLMSPHYGYPEKAGVM